MLTLLIFCIILETQELLRIPFYVSFQKVSMYLLHFTKAMKKFFAPSESSRKAAGNNNIKTVHDVLLMPDNLSFSACLY